MTKLDVERVRIQLNELEESVEFQDWEGIEHIIPPEEEETSLDGVVVKSSPEGLWKDNKKGDVYVEFVGDGHYEQHWGSVEMTKTGRHSRATATR